MDRHNRAIAFAQQMIRKVSDTLPNAMGMHGPAPHPDRSGMERSVEILDGLILSKEDD